MQDRRRGGKVTMGYPVEMIGAHTALFSLIGTDAIENQKEKLFNHFFKEMDVDCKMMPLNIRKDDIGFFLNGLKDSQIKAVYFEKEYWEQLYTLLPTDDQEINFCGICDTIDIKEGSYQMRLSLGEAITALLENTKNHTIMIVGSSPEAKSTLFHLIKQKPAKIILADEVIENLMDMMRVIPNDIDHDIVRLQEETSLDSCDYIINFSDKMIQSDIDFNKDFDKIVNKIAEINTKKWSQHG